MGIHWGSGVIFHPEIIGVIWTPTEITGIYIYIGGPPTEAWRCVQLFARFEKDDWETQRLPLESFRSEFAGQTSP